MDAPESSGHFPRQEAQAVGASASLLPICTLLAPRIPGSSTQVACWLSPRSARGGFWQLWQHQIPVTSTCVRWDAKPSSDGQAAPPSPLLKLHGSSPAPPLILQEQKLYPRPRKVPSEVRDSGPVPIGKHRRHTALARGESTVFQNALDC